MPARPRGSGRGSVALTQGESHLSVIDGSSPVTHDRGHGLVAHGDAERVIHDDVDQAGGTERLADLASRESVRVLSLTLPVPLHEQPPVSKTCHQ